MNASYHKHTLKFKQPSGTSRGVMTTKETWFIKITNQKKTGIGECGILKGLSIDDRNGYENQLKYICKHIELGKNQLLNLSKEWPSIQFGIEQAFLSLKSKHPFELFPSKFTEKKDFIPINGLIWMGTNEFMRAQIKEKIEAGFDCIKMKIGAIDFDTELNILKSIRKEFSKNDIELRVDANGAFETNEALEKLKQLSEFDLHSIEQPIKPKQFNEMAKLCESSPLPIALDEELIGVFDFEEKKKILNHIKPQFIILKPSLVGGYLASQEWINAAKTFNINWWITSALESNVGLNAIAQWTYTLKNEMPQGLGTGGLFTNNFDAPLIVKNGTLQYDKDLKWNFNL